MKTDAIPILILGMHRSGTSALAGCLDALGATVGEPLLEVQADNPTGYFELAPVVEVHERLLRRFGINFFERPAAEGGWSIPALPNDWRSHAAAREARDSLLRIVEKTFVKAGMFTIKDPRLCILMPLWIDILRDLRLEPRIVLIYRDPVEVAQSLEKRNGLCAEASALLWLFSNMRAEESTRSCARAATTYERLLEDPVREIERLASTLRIAWPTPPAPDRLAPFASPGLRHCRDNSGNPPADDSVEGIARRVYRYVAGCVEQGRNIAFENGFAGLTWDAMASDLIAAHRRALRKMNEAKEERCSAMDKCFRKAERGHARAVQRLTAELAHANATGRAAREEADRERIEKERGVTLAGRFHERFIRLAWERLARERSVRRVWIYGAGKYTAWLLDTVRGQPGPGIAGILDDAPSAASPCRGRRIPIVETSKARLRPTDGVILGTDVHQAAMKRRLRELGVPARRIAGFYDRLPPGPYPKPRRNETAGRETQPHREGG
jgi:hypothetical protein